MLESRGSAVGIATGNGIDDRRVGVRVPLGSTTLTSPYRADWFWGPPRIQFNGYVGLFTPEDKAAAAWSLQFASN
jgi:hypothetical protein